MLENTDPARTNFKLLYKEHYAMTHPLREFKPYTPKVQTEHLADLKNIYNNLMSSEKV